MTRLCDPDRDWDAYFCSRCVVNEDGCWEWQGCRDVDTYGKAQHRYADQSSTWAAHRLAWTAFRGPIPEGLTIDHLCFTPPCCNHRACRICRRASAAKRRSGNPTPTTATVIAGIQATREADQRARWVAALGRWGR